MNHETSVRQLSDRSSELVRRLWKSSGWRSLLFDNEGERIQIIRQLSATGETGCALYIAALLLEPGKTFEAAARAIGALLEHASGDELLELDYAVRQSYQWWGRDRWRNVKPAWVQSLQISPEVAAKVFGMLSFHSNGHVREAAVQRLAELHGGSEMPFLLIRLNDWVQQVRDRSSRAVQSRLSANEFAGFFDYLDLVFRLKYCGRGDHSADLNEVIYRLDSPEAAGLTERALGSSSRFIRREAYATFVAAAEGRARFIKLALVSRDGVLRLWAARDAQLHLNDEELQTILPSLLADRFMPVRREAINCVLTRFSADAQRVLSESLLDPSIGLREFVRFHLRKFEVDLAPHYRQALHLSEKLSVAIVGLGETGTSDDVHLVEPFLLSERPSLRAAAVRSVGKLADEKFTRQLFVAVKDDSKRVTEEAVRAIRTRAEQISLEDLSDALRTESATHVLLACVELVDAREVWQSMPSLINAAASDDSDVASASRSKVLSKINRVFTKPTDEQRAQITASLHRNVSRLPPAFHMDVTKWLSLRV